MQLESLYQEIILDHYRNPRNRGLREPFDAQVQHVNPTCGDEVTLRVTLRDAGGEPGVADVSYDALGCSISQASASMMTEMIIGKTVREAMELSGEFLALMQSRGEGDPDEDVLGDAVAFEGVSKYPARIKCALLGWMAWKDATARALDSPAAQQGESGPVGQRAGYGRAAEDAHATANGQANGRANGQAGNGQIAADAAREQT
jgi:nitrogen fixation NifU-like protein